VTSDERESECRSQEPEVRREERESGVGARGAGGDGKLEISDSRQKNKKGGSQTRPYSRINPGDPDQEHPDRERRDRSGKVGASTPIKNIGTSLEGRAQPTREPFVHERQNQKAGTEPGLFDFNPGDDRLSHAVARAVP
jgi:hypothetical protein